ncbi:probable E3 ubiquitin-protein ligase ATL44 [Hordeum vulgare subsp. vulgare]|uniref:RING-type domain-containing protein n=1 Tax=Hordeum vulgare subsp. vulgare TaxID=112509 RepID=A0A8I6YVH1_HORVV|nr:probable E3 ubiquitin-protein ligase ATL44 [Hordeum vulgare subsp. vulgare]
MRAPASLLHRTALAAAGTGHTSSSPQQQEQTAPVMAVNSDMVVILASLLCALVCVLGLALVSRCACRRRRSASSSDHSPPPPKGLKKKAIDALPTVSFAATASPTISAACSSSECVICLAEFTEGEGLRVLPRCGHRFHVACVDAWLRTCATCPSCRAPIIAAAPAQPPATPTVVVVVAANNRCGRCGEVAAPAGGDGTMILP